MNFTSVNELQNFSFRDCTISRFEVVKDLSLLRMELEALIVEPRNSQNTHFTQSYAGTVYLRMTEAEVLSGTKVGYRLYDANGKLLSETPDELLTLEELAALPKRCEGAFLPEINVSEEKNDARVGVITVEFPPEEQYDTLPVETYEITVRFKDVILEWDFYMNKVDTPGM
ncbi:MAG: hypothetical protein IJT43_02175 [Stomatobaculum sp.]|nr:hypothetical protein [Stomatobaculum sp.]